MHSLAECPLRTFGCITTTDQYPFHILTCDHAAIDLFLTTTTSADCELDASLACYPADNALALLRNRALQYLRGKTIAEILAPDHDSCSLTEPPKTEHSSSTLQPFLITDRTLSGCSGDVYSKRAPRRLHGCIHSAIPYSSASSSVSSAMSGRQEQLQQRNQVVQQQTTSDPDLCNAAHITSCRVYVLKDITEMHDLALAATKDLQQYVSRSAYAMQSPTSSLFSRSPSTASSSSSLMPSDRTDSVPGNVTQRKLYCSEKDPDWSTMALHHDAISRSSSTSTCTSPSPTAPSSSSLPIESDTLIGAYNQQQQDFNPGLLLLHVTRFGTVDHAFVMPHPQQNQHVSSQSSIFQDTADVQSMSNTSVMSYAHPEDIRALCRGLDRLCKSLSFAFRIRWRCVQSQSRKLLQQKPQQTDSLTNDNPKTTIVDQKAVLTTHHEQEPIQKRDQRIIEFQGESFEEWIDPTAAPDPTLSSKIRSHQQDEQESKGMIEGSSEEYVWVEVKGTQSSGQPMLAVRPLTEHEVQELCRSASVSTSAKVASAGSLISSSRRSLSAQQQRHEKNSKEWRNRARRIRSEERIKLPKPFNVSALTTLTITPQPQHFKEMSLSMPGSLPFNTTTAMLNQHQAQPQHQLQLQQQQPSHSTSVGCCRSSSNGGMAMTMPSMLAYPASMPSQPWPTVLMTIALDAWKQWIQTVHAGQAQFQDWCEYVLEITIDQLIESVSLGLTLMGVENAEREEALEDEQRQDAVHQQQQQQQQHQQNVPKTPFKRIEPLDVDRPQQPQEQQHHHQTRAMSRHQQKLEGIHRMGQMLHHYPSIEGAVKTFGSSWLGRKIKSRIEVRLDMAADQVMDWWYGEESQDSAMVMPIPKVADANVNVGPSSAVQIQCVE